MGVKVTMPRWVANFENRSRSIRSEVAEALNEANQSTQSLAQQLAPVSVDGSHGNPPGFLRDSIVIVEEASESNLRAATEAQADYAGPVEHGFIHHGSGGAIDPQPFMYPAFENTKQQLKAKINRLIVNWFK